MGAEAKKATATALAMRTAEAMSAVELNLYKAEQSKRKQAAAADADEQELRAEAEKLEGMRDLVLRAQAEKAEEKAAAEEAAGKDEANTGSLGDPNRLQTELQAVPATAYYVAKVIEEFRKELHREFSSELASGQVEFNDRNITNYFISAPDIYGTAAPAPAPTNCFTVLDKSREAEIQERVIKSLERQLLRLSIRQRLRLQEVGGSSVFFREPSYTPEVVDRIADQLVAAVMDPNRGFPSDFDLDHPINDGQQAFLEDTFNVVSSIYESRYGNDNQRQQETRQVSPGSLG